MVSKEKSFYLSCDNRLGWDFGNCHSTGVPQSIDGTISFSNITYNLFSWKIENISDCIKEIFVSTKDFVQLFMDRRQFVFDFMDFLIKNHGTNNMILAVNCDSGKTNYYNENYNYRSKILAAFEEKYAHLFKAEVFEYLPPKRTSMYLNIDEGQVPCSTIIFYNSGKIEIQDTLMKEIQSYLRTGDKYDMCFRYHHAIATNDDRFDILAEQIFQLYWLRKSVKNEINYLNFKNSKFPTLSLEDIQKRSQKLKVYNQDIKKLWDQTVSCCLEILEGSTKTDSDLFADLSPHYLIALKNEFVTGSAFQASDVNNIEQISKLKLLVDDSDFESVSQNESSEENQAMEVGDSEEETTAGSSESQTISGAKKSDEIVSRKRKQDLSETCSELSTITMNNEDYRLLKLEMAQLLKMNILLSNDVLQPFVKTHDSNERVLLGFGSHQNRTKPNTNEGSEMFISPCPKECTIDDRQWICINCGEFFKTQGFQIVCSCGMTHVTNLKLECFDYKHPKDFFPCEHDFSTSGSRMSFL